MKKFFIVNDNLKRLRKVLGFTQEEFAAILEIKRSLLGAYEEHRAEVSSKIIWSWVDRGYLDKEELYDFMFLKNYTPKCGIPKLYENVKYHTKFYIYTLTDPSTNNIFYVGSTSDVEQRKKAHQTNKKLVTAYNLRMQGLSPQFDVVDEANSPEERVMLEEYWIQQIKSWGFKLENKQLEVTHAPTKGFTPAQLNQIADLLEIKKGLAEVQAIANRIDDIKKQIAA